MITIMGHAYQYQYWDAVNEIILSFLHSFQRNSFYEKYTFAH